MDDILQLIADRENNYPHALNKARERLLARLENEPEDGETLARLAEVQYWLGTHADDDAATEAFLAKAYGSGKGAQGRARDAVPAT